MDCPEFRRKHSLFLDSALPALDLVRARKHAVECAACANHDAKTRRALLLFRNLPHIEPSARFTEQLNLRLAQPQTFGSFAAGSFWLASSVAGIAAMLLVTIGVAVTALQSPGELRLAPAVASKPETTTSQIVAPTIAASMSVVIPAWPAVIMVERASQQLEDAEYLFTNQTPR
jgi:hypothetical protein